MIPNSRDTDSRSSPRRRRSTVARLRRAENRPLRSRSAAAPVALRALSAAVDSSTCFLISTLLLRELSRNHVSKKTLGRRSAPLLFTQWELPAGAEWPVALYHTLLRVLALSAIAGMAAFGFRMLRAHLHLAEKNRHRVRVANCIESFVQSALEPAQRDLILAKLVDSIVNFGDSGLIQHDGYDRSSPISGDVIGRIVAAISSKSSS